MAGLMTVAGLGMSLGGIGMAGHAASMAQDKMEAVRRKYEPGLNIDAITGQSLGNIGKYMPQAQGIGSTLNTYYANELNRLLDLANPQYSSTRNKYMSNLMDYLNGRVSGDEVSRIGRSAAGKALMGGFSGAQRGNLVARDLGITSEAMRQYGMNQVPNLARMFPSAAPVSIGSYLGPDPNQLINLRSAEQARMMQLDMANAGISGATQAWGQGLQQMGGALLGGGLMGMGSGGGSGGPSFPSYPGLKSGDYKGLAAGVGIGNPAGDAWRAYYEG